MYSSTKKFGLNIKTDMAATRPVYAGNECYQ